MPESYTKRFFDYSGTVITGFSVVPPGFFALLLTDRLLLEIDPDISPVGRIVTDLVFCVTAMGGKYGLIRSYNKESFKSLADFDVSSLLQKDFWRPSHSINYLFSIVGGAVVTELARLSLAQTADLARDYETPIGDGIASVLNSIWLQVPVLFANMVSNTLSFPSMHRMSFSLFADTLRRFFSSSEPLIASLKEQMALNQSSAPLIHQFNQLMVALKTKKPVEINSAYDALHGEMQKLFSGFQGITDETSQEKIQALLASAKDLTIDGLSQNLLASDLISSLPSPSPNIEKIVTVMILGLTAFCIVGLTNFWTISLYMAQAIGLAPVQFLIGTMDMMSMSALAFISTVCYRAAMLGLFQSELKKNSVVVLSKPQQYGVDAVSIFICGLGGMPNAYQSLALAKQALPFVIIAAITSFIIEIAGFTNLFQAYADKKVFDKIKVQAGDQAEFLEELFAFIKKINSIQAKPPQLSERWLLSRANNRALATGSPLLLNEHESDAKKATV